MKDTIYITMLDLNDRCFSFSFDRGGEVSWNLAQARALIDQDRSIATLEIAVDELHDSIQGHCYERGTTSTELDLTPGISAPIIDDRGKKIHILIEGFDRAARCLAAGKPFYADVLSDADAYACVFFKTADNLIPTGKENNK